MRWLLFLIALPCFAADLSPEAQLALTSLRPGERARLEAVLGDPTQLPLYRGDFVVDPAARLVTGKVALTITAKSPLTELYLRCTPNANHPGAVVLSRAKVNGKDTGLAQPDPSLYRVRVEAEKGEQLTVEFELKARVPKLPRATSALEDSPGGDYGAFSASDDTLQLVGLMPMIPPERAGKLFEGPSGIGDLGSFEPSNFIVSVVSPLGWRTVSSGQAVGEVPTGEGAVRFAYATAGARELPLLVLKGAKVTSKQVGEVTVEAVLFGNAKQATQVTEHAAKALELLEAKLGPYPFKTLRVVEMRLVNGAGGMEFPGLVSVSTSLLSGQTDPLEALGLGGEEMQAAMLLLGPMMGQLMKNTLEFTIDHEIAHQYTAMLVGNDPIAEPVADEPLTQHLALLLLEWRQGKQAAAAMRDGQLKAAYQLHRLMGGVDGKANRATHEYSSNREYAALIYGKAPLLFDEQRKLVGDEAWLKGLKSYVEQNRYRWVTSRTLTELVGKQNPVHAKKLEALRNHWWNEAHGDDDIGGLDLNSLLTGGSMQGLDPKVMQELEKAMKALGGQ
ncbi:MAG: aminopeptidase [Archangium sp.]|nr:aminopeptidase [Archangium sp.]MDP3157133.1 aminopeptidase [Archangium sp.]MDP3575850.1 aminopeptidase [Archangium sp.]